MYASRAKDDGKMLRPRVIVALFEVVVVLCCAVQAVETGLLPQSMVAMFDKDFVMCSGHG